MANEKDAAIFAWLANLGIEGLDPALFQMAFTHPSYKGLDPTAADYEKLEFLGDAVLNLVTAEELAADFTESEGVMTERRKALVNNEFLAQVFDRLKMAKFLRAAVAYAPSVKDKANVVEAFVGAVFFRHGYEKSRALWDTIHTKIGAPRKKKVLAPASAEEQANQAACIAFYKTLGLAPKNAKNTLQELCQKQGMPMPEYADLEKEGPDHNPTFRVKVVAKPLNALPVKTYTAIGKGRTKKIAEMRAAEQLCDQIYLPYVAFDGQ